jgi:acyl-CoA thioesterase FadM
MNGRRNISSSFANTGRDAHLASDSPAESDMPMNLPPLRTLFFEDLSIGMTERLEKTVALPGPGAVYISQTLNFRAPVKIGDTVFVTVTVAELMPEKSRARLSCLCEVDGEVVLDGEALVKVPSEKAAKDKRPVMKL